MEIPVLSRISDFEAGVSSLHSFISRIPSLWGFDNIIPQTYSFWKWSALFLATLAAFTSVINRIKALIVRFRRDDDSPSSKHLPDDEEHSTDDDDEITSPSDSSDSEEEDDYREQFRNSQATADEDLPVAGRDYYSDGLRRRHRSIGDRSWWTGFSSGKSVVKLWDGLGLGLHSHPNCPPGNAVSLSEFNVNRTIDSILPGKCKIPAFSTAGVGGSGSVALKLWDPRIGRRFPAMFAEWSLPGRNDVAGEYLTVGDVRKVRSPLGSVTESAEDTWSDADGVGVTGDFSSSQWCHGAVTE